MLQRAMIWSSLRSCGRCQHLCVGSKPGSPAMAVMQCSISSHRDNGSPEHLRQQLLVEGLKHVKQHGWTDAALHAAAHDLGLSPAVVGILPRREAELVEHFIKKCNAQLASEMQHHQADWSQLRTKERIAWALRKRLEMLHGHIDSWPKALSVLSSPQNAPHALKLLGQMVDDIWYAVGDTSTDINWYTKRALLAGVYSSSEVYMLTDYSPNYEDTWKALDRQLDDMMQLAAVTNKLNNALSSTLHHLGMLPAGLLHFNEYSPASSAPYRQQQWQQHDSKTESFGHSATALHTAVPQANASPQHTQHPAAPPMEAMKGGPQITPALNAADAALHQA